MAVDSHIVQAVTSVVAKGKEMELHHFIDFPVKIEILQ